jgi:hypothetical protein
MHGSAFGVAGFYPAGAPPKSNQQAQIDLIEETLSFAGVQQVTSMVDVGCGIGGSTRHILKCVGNVSVLCGVQVPMTPEVLAFSVLHWRGAVKRVINIS